jgi:RecA-family ATPase
MSYAGEDATLGRADRNGIVQPTPLFMCLTDAMSKIKPKLIALDTSSDIFAGAENDRSQVRQFIALMRGIAIAADAAVVITSHPSLTGINTGTGLSGSTAWHNAVRARMYLTATGEDAELRELQFKKNNYGPIANRLLLRWKNGVYVPEPGAGSIERLATDQKTDELFLTLLGQFERQGRNVSDKPTSPTYAPTAFGKETAANGTRREALADAMRRLFAAGKIHVAQYGRPSRPYSKLVAGPKPEERT